MRGSSFLWYCIPMTIFVFGNPDVLLDSSPLRILPRLRARFPDIQFQEVDPNEEWDAPEEVTVIDTVIGIEKVMILDGLEQFAAAPRVTMHDFDALAQLRYLQKLGKIKKVTVVGVPPTISEDEALEEVSAAIEK